MISAYGWNKIYHLTMIALPHYWVKYEEAHYFAKTRMLLVVVVL